MKYEIGSAVVLSMLALTSPVASGDTSFDKPHPVGELEVIYLGEKTIDAAPYYEKLTRKEAEARQVMVRSRQAMRLPSLERNPAASLQDLFPVTTRRMQPGEPIQVTTSRLFKPFFLMGMDEDSLSWLREHYDALRDIGAYGLVVEATDWQDWLRLQAEAQQQGMTLNLLPGDSLAEIYGITTYPALVVGE